MKEWDTAAKALATEQEVYRKTLEGEAKKLRSEISEECNRFDVGMQELMDARLRTDYTVYEQELYKIKLIQVILCSAPVSFLSGQELRRLDFVRYMIMQRPCHNLHERML